MGLTFLNAAFLAAAFVALLPILIHLISRRRVKTVDFSSIRFLKELERKRIKRVRLRQILLLIIRSLILLAAALALARPTLRGAVAGPSGSHAKTSVAIVFDDSASMSRAGAEDELLIERARTIGHEIAGLLAEGDQAFLITASDPPRDVLPDGTFSRDVLREAIDEIDPGSTPTDYTAAIEQAWQLLSESKNLNREIYVIGDFQRTGWRDVQALAGLRGGAGTESEDVPDTRFYLIETSGSQSNLGISDVLVSRKYGGDPGSYSITAEIGNLSPRAEDLLVRLMIDGVQVGQAGVNAEPGQVVSAKFVASVDQSSWHSGWVELPDDVLAVDNRRYFVLPQERQTEVLIVAPSTGDERDDHYYIERALSPTGAGAFRSVVVDADALSSQERGRFPVVVLADVGRLSDSALAWLLEHTEAQGAVLIVLGNRTDVRYWNAGSLAELVNAAIVAPFERTDASGVRLSPADIAHPLLEGLVTGERLVDDVRVRRGFRVDAPEAEALLEFPGLGPALIVGTSPRGGDVAMLMTGVDPHWSGLARSGFLVPLFHRLTGRLAGGGASSYQVLVGEDLMVPIESPRGLGSIEVSVPGGAMELAESRDTGSPAVALGSTSEPGIYRFSSGGQEVALGAANVDPSESALEPASREDVAGWMSSLEYRFVSTDRPLGETILEARVGRELWRVFVYLALALIAIEMLIARPRTA